MKKLFVVNDEEVEKAKTDPVQDWKTVQEYNSVQAFFSNNLEHDRAVEDFNQWWGEEHARFTAEDLEDY